MCERKVASFCPCKLCPDPCQPGLRQTAPMTLTVHFPQKLKATRAKKSRELRSILLLFPHFNWAKLSLSQSCPAFLLGSGSWFMSFVFSGPISFSTTPPFHQSLHCLATLWSVFAETPSGEGRRGIRSFHVTKIRPHIITFIFFVHCLSVR